MRHFPIRELGYAIGFIVVALVLYVGAYFTTMSQGFLGDDGAIHDFDPDVVLTDEDLVFPRYPIDGLAEFFRPLHQIDRIVRSDYWAVDRGPSKEEIDRILSEMPKEP